MSVPIEREIEALHRAVDTMVAPLEARHADRLQCARGCHDCCVDGLSVFEAEADVIRMHYPELLAEGEAHAPGACAFLDGEGACRIYDHRPYVCRTQGLPLRWLDEEGGEVVERRDICPLNETEAEPLEALAPEACWALGPVEERLQLVQLRRRPEGARVPLRRLFVAR